MQQQQLPHPASAGAAESNSSGKQQQQQQQGVGSELAAAGNGHGCLQPSNTLTSIPVLPQTAIELESMLQALPQHPLMRDQRQVGTCYTLQNAFHGMEQNAI